MTNPPEKQNNIVRVDFAAGSRRGKTNRLLSPPPPPLPQPPPQPAPHLPWWADLDLRSPWVLRLLAVVFLLILSMLIL